MLDVDRAFEVGKCWERRESRDQNFAKVASVTMINDIYRSRREIEGVWFFLFWIFVRCISKVSKGNQNV